MDSKIRREVDEGWFVRVTDLKQYEYCPRIVYFEHCLPGIRPTTFKMAAGILAQEKVNKLEERRSLRAYQIEEGERHFHVSVLSRKLRCSGQIDLVVETEKGDLIPIDFKLSRRQPGRHFKLQLACYAMMLEEDRQIAVEYGIIYLIPSKQSIRVEINKRLRNDTKKILHQIREVVEKQKMPNATKKRSRCVNCEFRRFCNDVL